MSGDRTENSEDLSINNEDQIGLKDPLPTSISKLRRSSKEKEHAAQIKGLFDEFLQAALPLVPEKRNSLESLESLESKKSKDEAAKSPGNPLVAALEFADGIEASEYVKADPEGARNATEAAVALNRKLQEILNKQGASEGLQSLFLQSDEAREDYAQEDLSGLLKCAAVTCSAGENADFSLVRNLMRAGVLNEINLDQNQVKSLIDVAKNLNPDDPQKTYALTEAMFSGGLSTNKNLPDPAALAAATEATAATAAAKKETAEINSSEIVDFFIAATKYTQYAAAKYAEPKGSDSLLSDQKANLVTRLERGLGTQGADGKPLLNLNAEMIVEVEDKKIVSRLALELIKAASIENKNDLMQFLSKNINAKDLAVYDLRNLGEEEDSSREKDSSKEKNAGKQIVNLFLKRTSAPSAPSEEEKDGEKATKTELKKIVAKIIVHVDPKFVIEKLSSDEKPSSTAASPSETSEKKGEGPQKALAEAVLEGYAAEGASTKNLSKALLEKCLGVLNSNLEEINESVVKKDSPESAAISAGEILKPENTIPKRLKGIFLNALLSGNNEVIELLLEKGVIKLLLEKGVINLLTEEIETPLQTYLNAAFACGNANAFKAIHKRMLEIQPGAKDADVKATAIQNPVDLPKTTLEAMVFCAHQVLVQKAEAAAATAETKSTSTTSTTTSTEATTATAETKSADKEKSADQKIPVDLTENQRVLIKTIAKNLIKDDVQAIGTPQKLDGKLSELFNKYFKDTSKDATAPSTDSTVTAAADSAGDKNKAAQTAVFEAKGKIKEQFRDEIYRGNQELLVKAVFEALDAANNPFFERKKQAFDEASGLKSVSSQVKPPEKGELAANENVIHLLRLLEGGVNAQKLPDKNVQDHKRTALSFALEAGNDHLAKAIISDEKSFAEKDAEVLKNGLSMAINQVISSGRIDVFESILKKIEVLITDETDKAELKELPSKGVISEFYYSFAMDASGSSSRSQIMEAFLQKLSGKNFLGGLTDKKIDDWIAEFNNQIPQSVGEDAKKAAKKAAKEAVKKVVCRVKPEIFQDAIREAVSQDKVLFNKVEEMLGLFPELALLKEKEVKDKEGKDIVTLLVEKANGTDNETRASEIINKVLRDLGEKNSDNFSGVALGAIIASARQGRSLICNGIIDNAGSPGGQELANSIIRTISSSYKKEGLQEGQKEIIKHLAYNRLLDEFLGEKGRASLSKIFGGDKSNFDSFFTSFNAAAQDRIDQIKKAEAAAAEAERLAKAKAAAAEAEKAAADKAAAERAAKAAADKAAAAEAEKAAAERAGAERLAQAEKTKKAPAPAPAPVPAPVPPKAPAPVSPTAATAAKAAPETDLTTIEGVENGLDAIEQALKKNPALSTLKEIESKIIEYKAVLEGEKEKITKTVDPQKENIRKLERVLKKLKENGHAPGPKGKSQKPVLGGKVGQASVAAVSIAATAVFGALLSLTFVGIPIGLAVFALGANKFYNYVKTEKYKLADEEITKSKEVVSKADAELGKVEAALGRISALEAKVSANSAAPTKEGVNTGVKSEEVGKRTIPGFTASVVRSRAPDSIMDGPRL
jgi:hypothetical protein